MTLLVFGCLFYEEFKSNLWYELEDSIGEERPDGQADEVGQHFGEVRFFGEGDQQEPKQRCQVDDGDGQKPITPHCRDKSCINCKQVLTLQG